MYVVINQSSPLLISIFRARLAGMLAGGVWFRVVRAAVIIPADVEASVVYSAVLGGVVRPL